MKTLWLIHLVFVIGLIIPIPLFSQLGGQKYRVDRKTLDFFKSLYKKPVIEIFKGSHKKVFPSLAFYTVFEEEHLVEDPLIPDIWIRTSKGTYFIGNDMAEALKEERIVPENKNEALIFARELVLILYKAYYVVENSKSFSGEIPDIYNDKVFCPVVKKTDEGYFVRINVYFPDCRYAEYYSAYRNKLVEYVVKITGFTYQVQEGYVYSPGQNALEIQLTLAVVEHIGKKGLIDDLKQFLEMRNRYGVTDPPERSLVKKRIIDLSEIWDKDFVKKHGELHSLVREVLKRNPDFRFDSNFIYQKTKGVRCVRGMDNYQRTLEMLLQEIVERTRY
ncbi:MAG: hypothetical protein JW915_23565 [Chitinispirillaceae bacterium]|nr:hypothetical protein [Chitinispirillaceae bacterium]MBN2771417.1 hypothetical protein [Spirochaetota bacterium]